MGGKPKYHTEAERKAAKRESARRNYHKRKQEKAFNDEFDRFLAINPDLYSNKQPNEFDRLLSINPDIYTSKPKLTDEQKDFISSLINMPLDTKPSTKRLTRQTNSIAKQQLGLASSKIRSKKRTSIDFDLTQLKSEEERQYFFEHLPDVIHKLLDSINFNTEHWSVYYKYDNSWKTRTLDSITEQYMRDQVKHDLQEHMHDFIEYGADYDFFPVMIQSLTHIRFINVDNMPAPHGVIRRKRHEGKFWRWLLKGFPELNLERFMIFSQLDKHAASLIQRDNCFVYACQMAGLSDDLLNDLRYSIHKRSLSHKDITDLASKHNLKIHIKEPGRSYFINPSGTTPIRLVLMHNHYMIDEKVSVSPYYILHKKEITCHPIARHWTKADQMCITGKVQGYYHKAPPKFSLRKVLDALFQVNAFIPISMNDYRVYASLVCFENIDPIKRLDYKVEYCVKLKASKLSTC